jgi:hypothetical protein
MANLVPAKKIIIHHIDNIKKYGHTWPGGEPSFIPFNYKTEAYEIVWQDKYEMIGWAKWLPLPGNLPGTRIAVK